MAWRPFPEAQTLARVAKTLLDEKLIACVNILLPMRSLFVWNGESGEAREGRMLVKTDAVLLDRAMAWLEALHG